MAVTTAREGNRKAESCGVRLVYSQASRRVPLNGVRLDATPPRHHWRLCGSPSYHNNPFLPQPPVDRQCDGLRGYHVSAFLRRRPWPTIRHSRIMVYFMVRPDLIFLAHLYAKNEKENLTHAERNELQKIASEIQREFGG